jgi:hypothetical protein
MNDLTTQEEAHVRAALHFLRLRFGGWASLAKTLKFTEKTLGNVANRQTVSASMAMRIAKLVNVGVDDLLAGKFPSPGTCPYCGHQKEAAVDPFMGTGRPQQ